MKRMLTLALFAALALPAAAQNVPAPATGITVTGSASARFLVRTVEVIAFAHGVMNDADVVAAMRSAGLDDPSVAPQALAFPSRGGSVLRGVIQDVSPAKLASLATAAAAFVAAHPGVGIDNVQLRAPIVGCPALEEPVRVRALAEARRRAEAVAHDAGVTLAEPERVLETGGCPAESGDTNEIGRVAVEPGNLTATLTLNETVTFALKRP